MKKHIHIHIHIPAKKPQVAYLMRAKVETKDAGNYKATFEQSKFGNKGYRPKVLGADGRVVFLSQASYSTEMEAIRIAQDYIAQVERGVREPRTPIKGTADSSRTEDTSLVELQAKRDKLEADFDKADDAGDNRAMDRIRKELAALDAEIKKQKEQKAATKDEKLIKTLTGDKTMVKVFYDDEWEEFQAKLYYKKPFGWQEQNKASYHSDDKEDVLSTAADMLRRAEARTKDSDESLELSYAVEANPEKVGKRARKQFKTEAEFLAALKKGGMNEREPSVQKALAAFRSTMDAREQRFGLPVYTVEDSNEQTGTIVVVGGKWFYKKPNDPLRYGPYDSATEAAEAARKAGVKI